MSPTQNETIQKLKAQIARYEAKGYKDTAAHQVLARMLKKQPKPVEDVIPRNTKKVKQEAQDGE